MVSRVKMPGQNTCDVPCDLLSYSDLDIKRDVSFIDRENLEQSLVFGTNQYRSIARKPWYKLVQNFAARIVANKRKYEHVTPILYYCILY